MNTLNKVRTGDTVSVVKIHGQGSTRRRIMDNGDHQRHGSVCPEVAPLGDPIESKSTGI